MGSMMMETRSSQSLPDGTEIWSGDPSVAGMPGTPEPVICNYCGAEIQTKGVYILGRPIWLSAMERSCTCAEGEAYHQRTKAETEAKRKARADEEMRLQVSQLIRDSGLGERSLQQTFETFMPDTPELSRTAARIKKYAGTFPLSGRNGLLILGSIGSGKTHLANAVANDLLNRGIGVISLTERHLFGRIQATFARSRQWGREADSSEVLHTYETVPLLVIDDLGKEKASDWTLATIYAIIDGRYVRAMPTIVTTNYSDNLACRITPERGDITTAEAVVDRLREMCESIVITAASRRSKI